MAALILVFIAGLANGIMDLVSFRWGSNSIPNWMEKRASFWNPEISWKNKWSTKYTSKERFFLSSSALVFLTDGWHLCKEIMISSIALALTIHTQNPIIWFLIVRLFFAIGFYTFYRK